MLHPKILIIGAGAAGIAAASRLVANNICNITILEAEKRIGGRIFTTTFGDGTVELGAQWVHGEGNNVAHSLGSAASLLGDDSYDLTKARSVLSDGTFMEDNTAWQLYCLCKEILNDEQNLTNFKGSLGDYVRGSLPEKLKSLKVEIDAKTLHSFMEWFHRFQNSIDGSDSWFQTSAKGTLQYCECEGNLLTRWKTGGYANIFGLLMGSNSDKIKEKIIFNKTVKKISWERQPIEVMCTDGQTFTADHVLLTVSLAVLKEHASHLFVPSLPKQKLLAIQGIGIGTVDKIFLKFPYRWWPADCTGFSLLWRETDIPTESEFSASWLNDVFGFYCVDMQPLVLCGWVGGQSARHMERCSDQQVLQGCHQLLLKFLGSRYNIPAPDCLIRSSWNSNPHFRGSYSFRSLASDEADVWAADLASPLCSLSGHPVVLFGGEATHDHFYSTVHGAIETGWREADRLISLSGTRCRQNGNGDPSGMFSVIIVGAGMAGLAAATTLQEAGIHSFVILEGQERVGGRVCSVPMDDSGQNYIELGAQWVHGEDNPVFRLAAKEELLSNINSDEGLGLYLKPSGEQIPLALVQEVAGVVGEILEDCCLFVNQKDAPESVGEYLTHKFSQYLDACNDPPSIRKHKNDLFDWHVRFQMIDNSCDTLNCLSARAWGLYQYSGGKDYYNFHHSYSSLVNSLVRALPADCLRTQTCVTHVDCSPPRSQAMVLCEDGQELLADHVIVTSSLGYLKEHHHSMFIPPLPPDMVKAIDSMGFDTINKLFLVYDSPWWPDDMQGIQLIWDSQDHITSEHQSWLRDVSGFDVLPNLSGVLLGWVGGKGAVTMETLPAHQISQDCTQVIRRFLKRSDVPPPDRIFRSKWHSNKFVRGGYSHTTSQCDKGGCGSETLVQPVYLSTSGTSEEKQPVILLAGEAVQKHYFSTTHGAYMSGAKQARLIIDYLQKNKTL